MKKVMKVAVVLAMALVTAAGVLAQTSDVQNGSDGSNKPAAADKPVPAPQEADATSDYVIGADDTLRISVWKEPDLSEILPVRPDGKISMPFLNDIPRGGVTTLH